MLKELILKNRSFRRFDEKVAITRDALESLVDLARLTGSAANRQPLKYYLASDSELNGQLFPCLAWAGYLKDWSGPAVGERPTGYIVMVLDTAITANQAFDGGIAAQSILLGAVEQGLGGCMLAAVQWDEVRRILAIPDRYQPILMIALGKPVEQVVLEPMEPGPEADFKYWRDERQIHHVPKRALAEILLN